MNDPSLDSVPTHEFNEFLHALRTRALRDLPPGARTVVHGGAGGSWYFRWFDDVYPGCVERHIGVERYLPRPDDLPGNVEWIPESLGDIAAVPSGAADLVFAGQVIEHLWPEEIAGFLAEANRVLPEGGVIALDSPTRTIADLLVWTQPEHTVELEVEEAAELLSLAGFDDVQIHGIWLCRDPSSGRVLPLEVHAGGEEWPWRRRVVEARDHPEDSFVWWAQAVKRRAPDNEALASRVQAAATIARPRMLARLRPGVGSFHERDGRRMVGARQGVAGEVFRGPTIAIDPGNWCVVLELAAGPAPQPSPVRRLGGIEVWAGGSVVASLPLHGGGVTCDGRPRPAMLPFRIDRPAFGFEVRVRTTGAVRIDVARHVEVVPSRVRRPTLANDGAAHRAVLAGALGVGTRHALEPLRRAAERQARRVAHLVDVRVDRRAAPLVRRIEELERLVEGDAAGRGDLLEPGAVAPEFLAWARHEVPPAGCVVIVEDRNEALHAVLSQVIGPSGTLIVIQADAAGAAAVASRLEHLACRASVVVAVVVAEAGGWKEASGRAIVAHATLDALLEGVEPDVVILGASVPVDAALRGAGALVGRCPGLLWVCVAPTDSGKERSLRSAAAELALDLSPLSTLGRMPTAGPGEPDVPPLGPGYLVLGR